MMQQFPETVRNFAHVFVTLQGQRHQADYDPVPMFSRSDVQLSIQQAEQAIQMLEETETRDRRAFAVFVLFQRRRY